MINLKNKKAIYLTSVFIMIIGVAMILLLFKAGQKTAKGASDTVDTLQDQIPGGGFVPYKRDLSGEEAIVANSMRALINTINALAKGEALNVYTNDTIDTDPGFAKYRITWAGDVELEERDGIAGICIANACNSHRRWSFSKDFNVRIGAPTQSEDWVWADYNYGDCQGQEGQWSSDGYCNEADSAGDNRKGSIRSDITGTDLAAVRDIMPVYNIRLETLDASGNVLCVATSQHNDGTMASKEDLQGLVDEDMDEFITWGAVADWESTCGADNDGDGIKGQYCSNDYGKNWQDVMPAEIQSQVDPSKIARYFPEGKIMDRDNNGEGCLDSPTWLECPGIRIYYCGKWGYQGGVAGTDSEYYYIGKPGDDIFHSRSGTKFLRVVDKTKFSGTPPGASSTNTGYFSEFRNQAGDIHSDTNQIEVRDPNWDSLGQKARGAWEYARQYDLDVLLGFGVGGLFGGGVALATKEDEDPRVFCYGGKEYGQTTAKCDPELKACGVCDFELPDQPAAGYDSNVLLMAGYGDPKYVIYYESFPSGEDEAWHMEAMDLGLGSIMLWNAAGFLFDVGGIIADAGKITKVGSKLLSAAEKVPFLGWALKAVRGGKKIITRAGEATGEMITKWGDEIFELLKVAPRGSAEQLLSARRAFGRVGELFRTVDPEDLKGLHVNLAKVADDLAGAGPIERVAEFRRLWNSLPDEVKAEAGARMADPKFLRLVGVRAGAQQAEEWGAAYLIGMALAAEESKNEKYYPIGANAIGLKKPFNRAMVSGDRNLPAMDDKVKEYYLALVKDQKKGGGLTNILLDQNNERFYLASPCKANIQIVESLCPCWELDKDQEKATVHEITPGNPVQVLDISIDDTVSGEAQYNNAIKVCRDRSAGFTSLTLDQPVLQTKCMLINPVLQGDTFCYSGSHTLTQIVQIGILGTQLIASVGLDVGATLLSAATIETVGGPVVVAGVKACINLAIDVASSFFYNELEKTTKWPNH